MKNGFCWQGKFSYTELYTIHTYTRLILLLLTTKTMYLCKNDKSENIALTHTCHFLLTSVARLLTHLKLSKRNGAALIKRRCNTLIKWNTWMK